MIGKLKGAIDSYGEDFVILDVHGVGYLVHCSARTLQALPGEGVWKPAASGAGSRGAVRSCSSAMARHPPGSAIQPAFASTTASLSAT